MATPDAIPDEVLSLMAAKFRLLGDPTRLAVLRSVMMGGEMNVGQIVEQTGRGLANVSKHLKQLAEAGLLARRKEGPQVFYRLDDPVVEKICHLVCDSILTDMREQLERHRKVLGKKGDAGDVGG
jgi:DNA-binding transcriptional ArsR family regulator